MSLFKCFECNNDIQGYRDALKCAFCSRFIHTDCARLTGFQSSIVQPKDGLTLKLICHGCQIGIKEVPNMNKCLTDLLIQVDTLSNTVSNMREAMSAGETLCRRPPGVMPPPGFNLRPDGPKRQENLSNSAKYSLTPDMRRRH